MIAYHNDSTIKETILAQLRAHAAADELIKGQYWENGKGCAVGCTIHSSRHAEYETRFGIPAELAHLEDRIFEGLENGLAKAWPIRFMNAIPVGADLSMVWPAFGLWLLWEEVLPHAGDRTDVRKAIERVIVLYEAWVRTGERPSGDAADAAARAAADAAARAAADAASADAAYAAARAAADAAARAAADAAYAAARAAGAAGAAGAAAYAAYAAAAARAAAYADDAAARTVNVEETAYTRMADKLVTLLKVA